MNINKKIKQELVAQFTKHQESIISKWASQIMKVEGHRRHKGVVSVAKHKNGMRKFFRFFIAFLKNQHDRRSLKYLTSLIHDGHLSVNTAEDVMHGQILLRNILTQFLILKYKNNPSRLHTMLDLVIAAISVNNLHISNIYRKKDFNRVHTLVRSGRRLIGTKDLNKMLEIALDSAVKESGADRASIMLVGQHGVLKINASIGIPERITSKAEELLGRSIAGKVAKTNKAIIVNQGEKVNKNIKCLLKGLDVTSAISIPLAVDNSDAMGVLNLCKYHNKPPFDKEDLELLSILAYETAASIKSHQLVLETEGLYIGTIFALAAALDARDHYTHGHSRKVARYAVSIAKEMKLPIYQIEIIRRASLLHDIGKIGIPDKILNKPGRLTNKEYKVVKKHPETALHILKSIPQLKNLLPAIYHEHERFDGKGYTVGLRGEAIPLEARVIGVADAFDAMTSERPYRRPLCRKEALKELKRCTGNQFDAKVVKAFLKVIKKQ